VFTTNYDHHVEPAEARSLPLFMDVHRRFPQRVNRLTFSLVNAVVSWGIVPTVVSSFSAVVPSVRQSQMKPGRGEGAGFSRHFPPIAFDPLVASISLALGPSRRID
jgi:hypothetical protein